MSKFHFSTKTRQAEPCEAEKEPCQYGDHFDNEKDASLFADKQNEKDFGSFSTLAKTPKSHTHSLQASQDALNAYIAKEDNVDEDFQKILNNLIKDESSDLQFDIISEDSNFRIGNETLNDVYRFTLSDGSIGYFKPLREDEVLPMHSIFPVQEVVNEVAAYKLSQALGDGFDNLVPETTVRHFDGRLGSIQREVKGDTVKDIEETPTSRDHLANCIVLDYLIGNSDRHSGNYMYINPPPEFRMIDNGLAFLEKETWSSPTLSKFGHERMVITDEQMDKIKPSVQKLIDSPDHLGMDNYMSKRSLKHLLDKAQKIVEYKQFEDDDNMWD